MLAMSAPRSLAQSLRLHSSTFVGGSTALYGDGSSGNAGTVVNAVALDSLGNIYLAGQTTAVDFPTTKQAFLHQIPRRCPDGMPSDCSTSGIFLAKLDPSGTRLLYSTFIGGGTVHGLAVDRAGNAYVVGETYDFVAFPVTRDATQFGCPGFFDTTCGFLTVVNPEGRRLVYSTIVSGGVEGSSTVASAVAVDASGNVYASGTTNDPRFPVTKPSTGSGKQAFLMKWSQIRNRRVTLAFSFLFGGSGDETVTAMSVDSMGNVAIVGSTSSVDYPVTTTATQLECAIGSGEATCLSAFVSKFDTNADRLLYSSYWGGSANAYIRSVFLSDDGYILVGGFTISPDLPTTASAFQVSAPESSCFVQGFATRCSHGFVAAISAASGVPRFVTYLGGNHNDRVDSVAMSATGDIIAIGTTNSSNFPVSADAFQQVHSGQVCAGIAAIPCSDGFIVRFNGGGNRVEYSSAFGGLDDESVATGTISDLGSTIAFAGQTRSKDLPLRTPTFQTEFRGQVSGFIASFGIE